MAQKVFDFGRELSKIQVEIEQARMFREDDKARQAQELMSFIQMGIMDRGAARVLLEEMETDGWIADAKKKFEGPLKPVEKVEPAPGKRKIVL